MADDRSGPDGRVAPDWPGGRNGNAAPGDGHANRIPVARLRQRADFLKAASARRQGTAGFLLQARCRGDDEAMRVGFTCSKKVGNAVVRNRARRRLRALAAEILPEQGRAGWDYVLVGRPEATIQRVYADLRADLTGALDRVHTPSAQQARPKVAGVSTGKRR